SSPAFPIPQATSQAVIVLGFDTATPATAVAITGTDNDTELRHEPADGERPGHVSQLLPLIEQAIEQADTTWDQIERIAVDVGPGTFTGLRIGIATAHGLAHARGLPLAGVSSLEALAAEAAHDEHEGPVLAVLDARRGEAFAAAWTAGGAPLLEPAALGPEALAEQVKSLHPGTLAVGDGAVRFRGVLEAAGVAVPDDDSALHRVRARQVCLLGGRGSAGDPAQVLPLYLRAPDASPRRSP
ncbi:MAG TPA: tRNA (adenosine(37)-N6)-threonylcarbamoyltransferase complex dimerization subunit type 1 TsaB, partial [Solirubrobacteraceae bacterium]|nr:tRNA (adenosine(37)-N6)-threonylcarbamoyltransferase complex dimerization subunit type 1 TsaB [Solirubrobacteraceae bacterium]